MYLLRRYLDLGPPVLPLYPFLGEGSPTKTHLPKADLLTFWFSNVGPFLVKVPKGEPLISRSENRLQKSWYQRILPSLLKNLVGGLLETDWEFSVSLS